MGRKHGEDRVKCPKKVGRSAVVNFYDSLAVLAKRYLAILSFNPCERMASCLTVRFNPRAPKRFVGLCRVFVRWQSLGSSRP